MIIDTVLTLSDPQSPVVIRKHIMEALSQESTPAEVIEVGQEGHGEK